ncbi:MAG: PQQ-binding-like beta-propeller repeat protein [Pseudomonadota bacterium]
MSPDFTRRFARSFLAALAAASLSSCALFSSQPDTDAGEEDDPVSEDRISIMSLEQAITPDPRYTDLKLELPPSYVNTIWSQPGGEADHTLHHLQASGELKVAWRSRVGQGSERRSRITAPPIVAEDRVYALDAAAMVSAYDLEDGDRVWSTKLEPKEETRGFLWRRAQPREQGFGGGVAYEDGRLFVTSGFGYVVSLAAETGELLWRTDFEGPIRTAPTVYRGRVLFTTNDNELYALSTEDGAILWDFQALEETARILAAPSPAAAGDLVVAPFSSGEIVAVLAQNGRAVWSDSLTRSGRLTALYSLNDIAGRPVIDRGRVFAVSHSGSMAAVDVRTGERVWEKSIGSIQTPWVAGEYLFMVTTDAEIVCLSRRDGSVVWVEELRRYRKEKKKKGLVTWAGPVLVSGNLIVVSSDGEALTIAPETGEVRGSRKLGAGAFVTPVVAQETLLILEDNGRLTALR